MRPALLMVFAGIALTLSAIEARALGPGECAAYADLAAQQAKSAAAAKCGRVGGFTGAT